MVEKQEEVMGVDKGSLNRYLMALRVDGATDEELKGFVCHPMHPFMVELATEEIERRQREEERRDD